MLIYNHRLRLMPQIVEFNQIKENKSLPRLISGLLYAHKEYGLLQWEELLQPAINLAK